MSAENDSHDGDYQRSPSVDIVAEYEKISCVLAWCTMTLCTLGVVANVLSILVFTRPVMRTAPVNILLVGISLVDLCLTALSIPVFVVPGMQACYHSWWLLRLSSVTLVYLYPLTSAAQTASVWLLLLVTLERWLLVCCGVGVGGAGSVRCRHSLGVGGSGAFRDCNTRRRYWCAVASVAVLAVLYNLVRFFEYRLVSDENGEWRLQDWLKRTDGPAYHTYMHTYYIGSFLLTHFAGPFIALAVGNGLILRTIVIARRRQKLLLKRERKEHRTSLMMVIVVLTFLGCYSLPFALNVVESIDSKGFFGERFVLAYALNDVCNLLIVLNATVSAFVYYNFNSLYRNICAQMLVYVCFGSSAARMTAGNRRTMDESYRNEKSSLRK